MLPPLFIYLPIGCSVIEEKSGLMKPCQIPFIFKNETFYGCTTILGKSEAGVYRFGNPWCSTKTTVKHEHISNGGFYGDCLEENCPSAGEANEVLDSLFDNHLGMFFRLHRPGGQPLQTILKCVPKKSRLG